MKIGLIQNDSPYNIQEFLFREMKVVLEQEHHHVEIIPLVYRIENDRTIDILMDTVEKGNYDLLLTMDLTGFERRLMEDECFYNRVFCPMIHLITKDAWYFSHFLNQRLNFSMFFYIENDYNRRYIADTFRHFPNIETLPSCGFYRESRKWEERAIDVYFPVTYERPEDIYVQIEEKAPVFQNLIQRFIRDVMEGTPRSFYDSICDYLKQISFECTTDEMVDMMTELSIVTKYLKMYFADLCVRTLLDAGICVTVSGKGWDTYKGTEGRMPQILGENGLPYEEMLKIMGNSKVVLHNQSHKSTDLSEGVINARLQGAIVFSDRVCEDACIKKGVITYDIHHMEELPILVKQALQSPQPPQDFEIEDYSLRPIIENMVSNCFS